MILPCYTVVDPGAVVVHLVKAALTCLTVMSPIRFDLATVFTESYIRRICRKGRSFARITENTPYMSQKG